MWNTQMGKMDHQQRKVPKRMKDIWDAKKLALANRKDRYYREGRNDRHRQNFHKTIRKLGKFPSDGVYFIFDIRSLDEMEAGR